MQRRLFQGQEVGDANSPRGTNILSSKGKTGVFETLNPRSSRGRVTNFMSR